MRVCEETQPNKLHDLILSGRVKRIDEVWYWAEWSVSYAQQSVDSGKKFVTLAEAEAEFACQLAELRECWGRNGARFTEEETDVPHGGRRVRFRSIRKNGKPGTLTGLLYMSPVQAR